MGSTEKKYSLSNDVHEQANRDVIAGDFLIVPMSLWRSAAKLKGDKALLDCLDITLILWGEEKWRKIFKGLMKSQLKLISEKLRKDAF